MVSRSATMVALIVASMSCSPTPATAQVPYGRSGSISTPQWQASRAFPAHIEVRLPAQGELWFDQNRSSQSGAVRQFTTPPLDPQQQYVYDVVARWYDGGEVVWSGSVVVRGGERALLDLTDPRRLRMAPVVMVEEFPRTPRSPSHAAHQAPPHMVIAEFPPTPGAPASRPLTPGIQRSHYSNMVLQEFRPH